MQMLQSILSEHLKGFDVRVYMFGSRARGTAKRTSDIDLALTSPKALPDKLIQNLTEAFSESNIPYKVDIINLNAVAQTFKNAIINDLVEISY